MYNDYNYTMLHYMCTKIQTLINYGGGRVECVVATEAMVTGKNIE